MLDSISALQYELVYNAFSFTVAVMGAATAFLFLNRGQVAFIYRTAISISGLVTFIAMYHYIRIASSWSQSFSMVNGQIASSGIAFNDAYRYVDWLLTVPLLLIELILVMKLSQSETVAKATKLGSLAALMVILGYPGEISPDPGTRWFWWSLSMIPFLIIVYDLFIGLKKSIDSQPEAARGLVSAARYVTVVSWLFYPIVYVLPMVGLTGGSAVAAVQVGYTIADIVAKAGFGILIYMIAVRKSELEPDFVAAIPRGAKPSAV